MNDSMTDASTDALNVDLEIAAKPATVWRALTESSLIETWLMSNDFLPVVGHRFTFRTKPGPDHDGIVECEVLSVDEPRSLSYSWRGGNDDNRIDTVVTWTLTPTATGTRLHLEHAGFQPKDRSGFEGLGKGWRGHVCPRLQSVAEELERSAT